MFFFFLLIVDKSIVVVFKFSVLHPGTVFGGQDNVSARLGKTVTKASKRLSEIELVLILITANMTGTAPQCVQSCCTEEYILCRM